MMEFYLFRRQFNIIKNIKYLIKPINEELIIKQQQQKIIAITNCINRNSNLLQQQQQQQKQIRYISLTQPKYKGNSTNFGVHWKYEKALSVSLMFLYPAAFLVPSPIMDYILISTTLVHYFYGLESMVSDYVRPILFGPFMPKFAKFWVIVYTLSVFYGLVQFTRNDVGVVKAIQLLWAVQGYDGQERQRRRECGPCSPKE